MRRGFSEYMKEIGGEILRDVPFLLRALRTTNRVAAGVCGLVATVPLLLGGPVSVALACAAIGAGFFAGAVLCEMAAVGVEKKIAAIDDKENSAPAAPKSLLLEKNQLKLVEVRFDRSIAANDARVDMPGLTDMKDWAALGDALRATFNVASQKHHDRVTGFTLAIDTGMPVDKAVVTLAAEERNHGDTGLRLERLRSAIMNLGAECA